MVALGRETVSFKSKNSTRAYPSPGVAELSATVAVQAGGTEGDGNGTMVGYIADSRESSGACPDCCIGVASGLSIQLSLNSTGVPQWRRSRVGSGRGERPACATVL